MSRRETNGFLSVVWQMLLLMLLYGCCAGFNPLFAFDNRIGQTDGESFAELQLPTEQDGMIFRPKVPIPIYGRFIEQFTIFKNGLIALDDVSVGSLPLDYPNNTQNNSERLQNLEGRYLSVFTSVNDGPFGSITVRETDPRNISLMGCINAKQVTRIQRLIHLSYPSDQQFEATSIVSVTWANMTNRMVDSNKTNTFVLVIFTNGVTSYAVFQYWDIQWPTADVSISNALAPEAGIFMRPLGGYQLPRSGHSIEPSFWMTESNVAVPGEWLIPLSDASVTTTSLFDLLPKLLAEFTQTVQEDCKDISQIPVEIHKETLIKRVPKTGNKTELLNDSPTESTEWEEPDYTDDWTDEEEFTHSDPDTYDSGLFPSDLKQEPDTDNYTPETTPTELPEDPMTYVVPETEIPLGLYDGDEERHFTVEPPIIPETYIPLEDDRTSIPEEYTHERTPYQETMSSPIEPRASQTERCDSNSSAECTSEESDCYRVDGNTCCVCREGFYGSGNKYCWHETMDYKFAFNGTMTVRLDPSDTAKVLVAYLDIQHGLVKRSSSGVRDGLSTDPSYRTLRLLTPMFHVLNSIVSSSCTNTARSGHENQREFSIFTLGAAFRSTFAIRFMFDIEHFGQLSARVLFKLDEDTSKSFSRGTIQIEVTASEPVTPIDRSYHEAYGVAGSGEKSYYASYHVDKYGRIVFPEQSVKFVAEQRSTDDRDKEKDELTLRWSAMAEMQPVVGEDPGAGCLLKSDTIVPRDKPFYLRLRDRGYCSEDCSSANGLCNLFCVDEPLLFSYLPNACDCINCERDGEICVPEGASYSCSCRPGLRRMDDRTCRADEHNPDTPLDQESCGPVRCHANARCINPTQGFCQCLPGFRGDGAERCDQDPCALCRRNEVCVNDVCTPSGVDLCEGVRCGENAYCQDGACICTPGYTGDPMVRCLEERDPCANVRCHHYGVCDAGICRCIEGYEGDGEVDCRPVGTDLCDGQQCHERARCVNNRCQCIEGYEGNGYSECRPNYYDPCEGVTCHAHGVCHQGRCQCRDGYEGDGYWDCKPRSQDPCTTVQCHPNAFCEWGQCRCASGFEGDGYRECKPVIRDLCEGVKCHAHGACHQGRCQCRDGFEGDGYWECKPRSQDPCTGVQCHPNALCEWGQCRCANGFEGDGYRECRPVIRDACANITCSENAFCRAGHCECNHGYHMDAYGRCITNSYDACAGLNCHKNGFCQDGRCYCRDGFEGDGYWECRSRNYDPCVNITCLDNAICRAGQCECNHGYQMDAYGRCIPIVYDACSNVKCHENGFCQDGRCYCRDGFEGDGYWECRPRNTDPCVNISCTENAVCRAGQCECNHGYQMDAYGRCILIVYDPCVNVTCPENAVCHAGQCECSHGYQMDVYGRCILIVYDRCYKIKCHANGYCRNGRCYCRDGFRGDGYWKCTPTIDPCATVHCHTNGTCENGRCRCRDGFEGDGYYECKPIYDPCSKVICHPYAKCESGQCRCTDGYTGDGFQECVPITTDPCHGVKCHADAQCDGGQCRCRPGYEGDGYWDCRPKHAELCAGVQCHPFGQCYENRCYCSHGYVGDGVNFCDARTEDPCQGIQCATNGRCNDGRCSCDPGFEGDGYNECKPALDKCADVRCHTYAQCQDGQCRCLEGYEGDGYHDCRPKVVGPCEDNQCHPYARCVNDRCECNAGYEGDGYTCKERPVDPNQCSNCRGIPFKELAQCVHGRCVCAPGFVESHPGLCMECIQENCHANATCLPNPEYNKAYSCQCKRGYIGDGVHDCRPSEDTRPEVDPTCGGPDGCRVRNAECNRATGQCECRPGYEGDANYMCVWSCSLCLADAECDRQNERCNCKPGFYGDGQTYCERIPTTPAPIQVHITGQGDVLRIADLSRPLELRCYVTTRDESVTGQWIQPDGSQHGVISISRLSNGTEILLRIAHPAITDVGRYTCRAGQVEEHIQVAIEETALPYDVFLTSDDGILKVHSSGVNSSIATLWNIAENNKYGRVAMVADCNTQRIIYTSDYGHSIRWGDANTQQKSLISNQLFTSERHRFRNLAIDPPSGNVFAWDEAFGKIVVLNPSKPQMTYTLEMIRSFQEATPIRMAGLAVHSERGLLYWASFTDGWMPNGTIQVADMTGENEGQLIQLNGEPLALSISPSVENSGNSAGHLCWIQRSITNVFALATELHCARLSLDGRHVINQERLRQFSPTEEPSWGMVHHRGTVLWTDASRTIYYAANPAKRVRIRHVCCSNRFQAIATLAACHPSTKNACSFSNGRCRYFCLPNGNQHSRTCVCPDNEPGCHREI